jgi:hypothetical protein
VSLRAKTVLSVVPLAIRAGLRIPLLMAAESVLPSSASWWLCWAYMKSVTPGTMQVRRLVISRELAVTGVLLARWRLLVSVTRQ